MHVFESILQQRAEKKYYCSKEDKNMIQCLWQRPVFLCWKVWQLFSSKKDRLLLSEVTRVRNKKITWDLTIHPADTYGLKYGHKEQTHPAGSVRVKQLEDVHPSLRGRDRCQFSVTDTERASSSVTSHQIWNESGVLDLVVRGWGHSDKLM